jgi:hypothetical protein
MDVEALQVTSLRSLFHRKSTGAGMPRVFKPGKTENVWASPTRRRKCDTGELIRLPTFIEFIQVIELNYGTSVDYSLPAPTHP